MTENKKAWLEPELIVLVRNKPEEAVLSACKSAVSGGGNNASDNGCHLVDCESVCSWAAQS